MSAGGPDPAPPQAPSGPGDGDGDDEAGLLERFPALAQLAGIGRRRVPFVQQLSAMECGAACLTMVLGYHGRFTTLDEVRDVLGSGRDGVNALGIINAAEHLGLRGRGVRIDLDEMQYIDAGTILHWRFDHFVVFERVRKDSVDIVDPASGRRSVPMDEFSRSFTGVALLFEPGDDFREEKQRSAGIVKFARKLLGTHKALLAQAITVSLLMQLMALAVPMLTGSIVDRVLPRQDRHLLLVLGAGLTGLVLFQFLATFVRAHVFLALRTQLDVRMTLGFLDHLLSLPYQFFQARSAGDLLMRMNSNATVREILTSTTLSTVLDGSLVVFYLVILVLADPTLAALSLGLAMLNIMVFLVTRRAKRELMTQAISKDARAQGYQIEMLSGMETLKSLGAEQRAAEHWSQLYVDVLNASLTRARLDAIVDSTLGALRFASPLLLLGYGATQVLDGKLTLGSMLALNAVAAGFLGPLSALVGTALALSTMGSYVERLEDVLKATPEQDRSQVRPARTLGGAMSLHKVCFKYSELGPLVLEDVSVEIPPGAFIGVVGKSGAGKSSLTALLAGLYKPTRGRILYDGQSIDDYDLRSIRRQLGVVTQSPSLFNATIRANISLANPSAAYDRIVAAARAARIHDEITSMPLGYDTPLLDRGASLSGGQRQRIALARALLGQPAVLILDEATSALDGITERQVQDQLADLKCTRVVIAHRLSTIRHADVILVLDDGKLVEQGNHDQLIAMGGHYAKLASPDAQPAA